MEGFHLLDNYGDILSLEDICEILNIGKNTAYKLLNSQTIPGFKIGHVWKISKETLNDYIKFSSNPQK